MKKLLIAIMLATTLTSFGQSNGHQSKSLLNDSVLSLVVSNTAGTIIVPGVTNLNSLLANGSTGAGTNAPTTTWTNTAGTWIVVSAANAASGTNTDQSAVNLFKDVDLAGDREFRGIQSIQAGLGGPTNYTVYGTLSTRIVGRSGKTGTVLFQLVPLYSDNVTNEPTAAGEVISWGVAVNNATPVIAVTNLPAYKVAGAKKLRVRAISNGDTSSASDVFITELKYNAFYP